MNVTTPSSPVATSCIIFLLNAGDWDLVKCLSHANKPYIVATKNSAQAMGFQLACNLAFLMHNLHSNNFPSVKKFCKDVWDSLSHLWSSATGKRKEVGCCKGESSCGKLHGRCWNLFF